MNDLRTKLKKPYRKAIRIPDFVWLGAAILVCVGVVQGHALYQKVYAEEIAARRAERMAPILAAARVRAAVEARAERDARVAEEERQRLEREAREQALQESFERYAECQVRNHTPGYCDEDWEPTPEFRALMQTMGYWER